MPLILQWIDLIWLPLAWLVIPKKLRWWGLATLVSCMVMMRLMTELMQSIGYPHGIIGLISMSVEMRGLLVHNFFYMVYVLLAFFSPNAYRSVFMAASITVFFASWLCFAAVMVL